MVKQSRSVRVDAGLLDELEVLARTRKIPVTFADQVDVGLRMLVRAARDEQTSRAAALTAADGDRARQAWLRLHGQ